MKKYNNIASQIVICFPICSIGYLLIMILSCIYWNGQLIDYMMICLGYIMVIFCAWFPLIYMKDTYIITYYNEEKICQRNLFKRKNLEYAYIKEIYVFGDYIYLTSKVYNLNYNGKEKFLGRKLFKILKKEIIILTQTDADFLKYISIENKNVHIFKTRLTRILSKYGIYE